MEQNLYLDNIENESDINITIDVMENDPDKIYHNKAPGVPLWYYTSMCVVLTSLGINGMLLNGLVIRGFILRPSVRTPYNALVLNLAFVEFVLAFVGVTLDVQALVQNGWVLGKNICIASGALVTTSGFVSMLTLCALSVCRYGSIFRYGNIAENVHSYKTSSKILSLIWLYSFALTLPPLCGWGRYVPELSGVGCAPDWHSANKSKTYILYILIFGFVIPTTITIIASILTCVEARILTFNEAREENFKKHKRKFQLLLIMNFSYLICWSPYALLCITHTFISKTSIGPLLSMIPTVTVKLSVCINPILYIAYNPQFHGTFTRNNSRKRRNSKTISRRVRQNKNRAAHARTDGEVVEIKDLQPLKSILKASVQLQIAGAKDIENKPNTVLV